MNTVEQVKLELAEMKKIGIRVSAKALAYPEAHAEEIEEYRQNGMSISEIADLVGDLT